MEQDKDLKFEVRKYLKQHCRSRAYAIKAAQLAVIFKTTLREINSAVRDNRKDGHLIGSSKEKPYGYYIPMTPKECGEYLESFKSELFDMLQTYNRQKRAKREFIENFHLRKHQSTETGQLVLAI